MREPSRLTVLAHIDPKQLEHVPTLPTIRLGMKLFLLTMVRKSESQDAVWDEVDFENAVWTIPKERMKRSKAHNVYLSRQALDIMIALKTCSGNRHMLQEWADITDAWVVGKKRVPVLVPPAMTLLELDPAL